MRQPLAAQAGEAVLDRHHRHPLARRVAGAADVRQQHDVRRAEQRIARRQRLDLHHVEPSAGDPALLERMDERALVDDAAARRVDEDRRALHRSQLLRADDVARLGRQRHVKAHEIGRSQQIVERNALGRRMRLGHCRPAGVEHAHAEARRTPRDGLPDLAEPDDAERRAVDVAPEQQARVPRAPAALPHQPLRLDDAAGAREHQREGEIGGRLGQHARRVADGDAALARRCNINIVVAHGEVADHAKSRRLREEGAIDPVREQADDAVRARDASRQLVVRRRQVAGPQIDLGDGAKLLDSVARQTSGDEHARHGGSVLGEALRGLCRRSHPRVVHG